jgi:alpha-tubulin suppressor-like RCC1 family protein
LYIVVLIKRSFQLDKVCCEYPLNSFDLRFRGKGDYYRLGHGNDSHVRRPQVVEVFRGKKIVDVAVGALHCLAVTEQGQVRARF